MSNELTVSEDIFSPSNLTKETIKKYLCKLASDQELIMGLQVAKAYNLNPIKREIYFIKYGEEPMSVVLGYEVYLKRADRTGKYAGLKTWTEGNVRENTLKGCVEITVKGWEKPLYHECFYSEYVGRKKDGTPNKFWANKPITMIKKVTVAQAFKLAFPDEFAGMPPIAEELDDNSIVDIEIDPTKSRVEALVESQIAQETKEDVKQEEIKPKAEEKQPEKSKKTTKKEDTKPDIKSADRQQDVKTVIGLIDNKAQGPNGEIICVLISDQPINNPYTNKLDIKYSFLLDGKRYGTWDTSLAKKVMDCIDNRRLVKFEYKERLGGKDGKQVFNDIINFSEANTDEVEIK